MYAAPKTYRTKIVKKRNLSYALNLAIDLLRSPAGTEEELQSRKRMRMALRTANDIMRSTSDETESKDNLKNSKILANASRGIDEAIAIAVKRQISEKRKGEMIECMNEAKSRIEIRRANLAQNGIKKRNLAYA